MYERNMLVCILLASSIQYAKVLIATVVRLLTRLVHTTCLAAS